VAAADIEPRFPPPQDGLQVNCCKNPECVQFGAPPPGSVAPGRKRNEDAAPRYARTWAASRTAKTTKTWRIRCGACKETSPLKSNRGVIEEFQRLLRPAKAPDAGCPKEGCPQRGVPIRARPSGYVRFGRSEAGSRRVRCEACGGAFSPDRGWSGDGERLLNVFKDLVSKAPLRRVLWRERAGASSVYACLRRIRERCLAVARTAEADRLRSRSFESRRYLATDRQEYTANWRRKEDRRHRRYQNVATADLETGYVLACHVNYDPDADPSRVEAELEASGEYARPGPFRRHARLWTAADEEESSAALRARERARKREERKGARRLHENIESRYEDLQAREDIERSDAPEPNAESARDPRGMQVHAEYTAYAHFLYLRHLLGEAGKVRCFMDQESSLRAGFLTAFRDRAKGRTADGFYVRSSGKGLTIDEKIEAVAERRKALRRRMTKYGLSEPEALIQALLEAVSDARAHGKWRDRWIEHPKPHRGEPEKAVCPLTDARDMSDEHLAWLANKASLHALNVFFQRTRRYLSLLERPVASANSLRTWCGYGPYEPARLQEVLDIFRTYHNFCLPGKDKKTPAMREGLTDRPWREEDILAFEEPLPLPERRPERRADAAAPPPAGEARKASVGGGLSL